MTTLTATSAKEKFLSLLRKTHEFGEKYTITNNGKPYAILMSNDEYEGLIETLIILKDKNATKELLAAIKEADKGHSVSFERATGRKQNK